MTEAREARIASEQHMLDFLFAGNATFTLKSMKTGDHRTFNVTRGRLCATTFYVHDNFHRTLGLLNTAHNPTKWKRMLDSKDTTIFGWWWRHINSPQVELHHVGKCGKCSRPLTNPESIKRGIGPECFKALGLDIPDTNIEDLFK